MDFSIPPQYNNVKTLILAMALVSIISAASTYVMRNYTGALVNRVFEHEEKKEVCGGLIGKICSAGYSCNIKDTYPDATGVCEKNKLFGVF